jgi:hypothetical protein
MNRITRLLSGGLFGIALASAGIAALPGSAWAQVSPIKLACDGNICCTYDTTSGDIKDCQKVS